MEIERVFTGGVESVTITQNKKEEVLKDLPHVRLEPEQIEEIHADEYSLKIFYATRVQALTLGEIKRKFPEPSPKKAQSVLTRFVDCGLVHTTGEGKYYSNFPENYINYSDYKYDADLEAKKDAKVFEIMKEFTGNTEYWKTKAYYSIDSFFTDEQTAELKALFQAIKFKSKQFANDNARRGKVDGLTFRRLKFYDMVLSIFVIVSFLMGSTDRAFAGNDPGIIQMREMSTNIYPLTVEELIQKMYEYNSDSFGEGNDPGQPRFQRSRVQLDLSIDSSRFNYATDPFPESLLTDNEIENCGWQIDNVGGELKLIKNACLEAIEQTSFGVCHGGVNEFCSLIPKVFRTKSELNH